MSAICKAASTRSSSRLAAIVHPTTFREKIASTTARYSQPWLVQTPVMAATHFSFGCSKVECAIQPIGRFRQGGVAIGGTGPAMSAAGRQAALVHQARNLFPRARTSLIAQLGLDAWAAIRLTAVMEDLLDPPR